MGGGKGFKKGLGRSDEERKLHFDMRMEHGRCGRRQKIGLRCVKTGRGVTGEERLSKLGAVRMWNKDMKFWGDFSWLVVESERSWLWLELATVPRKKGIIFLGGQF